VGEWDLGRFEDLMAISTRNGIHKSVQYQGSGTPVVKMGEVYSSMYVDDGDDRDLLDLSLSELSKLSIQVDDLLFCRTSLVADGVGRCAIVRDLSKTTSFASNLIRVRLDKKFGDPRFYHFVFRSPLGLNLMRSIVRGTSVSTITGPDISNLLVPVPPLAEQRAIAGVLGALDDKIESNRRQHNLIEQLVETSFRGICENFTGEYRLMGDLVDQGVSGVWGSETQQSESEVCVTCLRGVDLNSLATGVIPSAPLRWVSAGQSASRNPQEGEIWVEASGFRCGRSVVIGSHTSSLFRQPVRNSNFVKRLTPRKSVRDSYIAWLSLRKIYASGEINNFRTGTSIRNLDVDGILKNVRVPILDDAPASQLEGLVQCLLSPGRSKESSTLENLRDALLPELLSGRLRVKDAESMMEVV